MKALFGILIITMLTWNPLPAISLQTNDSNSKYHTTNRCQSGSIDMGYCLDINKCGSRDVVRAVLFPLPFAEKPSVLTIGLTYIDTAGGDRGTRLSISKEAITPFGFNVRFYSWHTSVTHQANVDWLACP